MKIAKTVCKTIVVAALTWLSNIAQAQTPLKGAQLLIKIQTPQDIQQIEPGDTVVMTCPKCKDTYVQVVEKSFHNAMPDELKTVGVHLYSSCDTRLVTQGQGNRQKRCWSTPAKSAAVRTFPVV